MTLSLVVAVSENGVIGADGDLAWRISDDLKWFKKNTLGKPIIMGRKTFDSIGRPLPGRDNIVLTRSRAFDPGGVFIVRDIETAISLGRHCAKARESEEVCVIGGGEIYAQTYSMADRIYLSRVQAVVEGDVSFPQIDSSDWEETPIGGCEANEKNSHPCRFFILNRRP